MSESIYNIIPKEYNPPPKGPIYKSKYPPNIPPTGSSFGHHTTSKPINSNLNGQFSRGLQAHTQYGGSKTFGYLKGDRKPSPPNYLKKHTGTMGNEELPSVRNFAYDCQHKKQSVPCVHEKPVMGLKSNKNFIVTNAIENILSTAKRAPTDTNWLKKKDYGVSPQYLSNVKENITSEYKLIQKLHEEGQYKQPYLTEEEVTELRNGLKRKWNQLNQEYQKHTHVRLVDTFGLKTRKENYEKQLAEIEADIKKLNKTYVFVDE